MTAAQMGRKGGRARARALSPERRRAIARAAALARWAAERKTLRGLQRSVRKTEKAILRA